MNKFNVDRLGPISFSLTSALGDLNTAMRNLKAARNIGGEMYLSEAENYLDLGTTVLERCLEEIIVIDENRRKRKYS